MLGHPLGGNFEPCHKSCLGTRKHRLRNFGAGSLSCLTIMQPSSLRGLGYQRLLIKIANTILALGHWLNHTGSKGSKSSFPEPFPADKLEGEGILELTEGPCVGKVSCFCLLCLEEFGFITNLI